MLKSLVNKIYKKIIGVQFVRFLLVGVIATLIDWVVFYVLAIIISVYYQFALATAFFFGAITNYFLNKIFTFKCKSKKIAMQLSVFFAVCLIYLLLSAIIMFVFVDLLALKKMLSRIITSFIMLFVNYIMHKNTTFNKHFFS